MKRNPLVVEVFTWVWLSELSSRYGRDVTLSDVPDEAWDGIARPGVDVVWLMGVWSRSPVGAAIARADPAMMAVFRSVLTDLTDDDIVGSAYCIRDYRVDPSLGGDEGLAVARAALASRGVQLVLDYVPNHVAPDHRWVREHPEYFIRGTPDDLAADPSSFVAIGDQVFACGRDPYFPAWTDVLQLDASRDDVRRAAVEVVSSIAERCDGVRCDMAMLVLDDVFARTWGARAGGRGSAGGPGYWRTVIDAVRARHREFVFWAEAYWDTEPVLVQQGFDACYDKRLYDRLVRREPASSVLDHLRADPAYQVHTVRFVENHDEPRLASVLEEPGARAVATVALTLPGVALLHEGQTEGRAVRVPVQLARRPSEPVRVDLEGWYDRLLAAMGDGLRRGDWALAPISGWPDNQSCAHLVAWTWTTGEYTHLVVVNLGHGRADGRIELKGVGVDVHQGWVVFTDLLSGASYEREATDIAANGLYVGLDAGGIHLLRWGSGPD